MSQRQEAMLSNIYQKLYSINARREGLVGGGRLQRVSFKKIQKHLHSATLELSFCLSLPAPVYLNGEGGQPLILHLPSIQLSDYMGQYGTLFNVTDSCCNSANTLGS